MKFQGKSRQIFPRIIIFNETGECVLAYWLLTRPLASYHQHIYDEIGEFDKIRTCGKGNFEKEFLEIVPQVLHKIIIH